MKSDLYRRQKKRDFSKRIRMVPTTNMSDLTDKKSRQGLMDSKMSSLRSPSVSTKVATKLLAKACIAHSQCLQTLNSRGGDSVADVGVMDRFLVGPSAILLAGTHVAYSRTDCGES